MCTNTYIAACIVNLSCTPVIHFMHFVLIIYIAFDCLGMAQKLKENLVSLVNLSYDNMRIYLYSKGVITDTEEMEIAGMNNNNQRQMEKVIKIIRDSLLNKHTKKFKCFLKSMEECSDELLKETARRYGEYIHMYLSCSSCQGDYNGHPLAIC